MFLGLDMRSVVGIAANRKGHALLRGNKHAKKETKNKTKKKMKTKNHFGDLIWPKPTISKSL